MSKKKGLEGENTALLERSKPQLKRPPLYQVVMLNDDYTPMDFVVLILETFFNMSSEQAVRLMMDVHNKGRAHCGVFTRDVAETKVAQVTDYARQHDHPLLCKIERV